VSSPFFSVIVPTYRRVAPLTLCLEALAALDWPRNEFEVIVVDDGGELLPTRAMDRLSERLNLTLLRKSHAGPAAARNFGVSQAKGSIVVFTDDDCQPAVDWLKALSSQYADNASVAVGGRAINGLPTNPYSTASQLLVDYLIDYFNPNPFDARFLTSNNLAFPRAEFLALGGFDETFLHAAAEDREICDRWLWKGHRLVYAETVKVVHSHGLGPSSFWRQHFGYGQGAFHFHRLRALRRQAPVRREPLSFYGNLLWHPFTREQFRRCPALGTLLALSQVATVAGFLREKSGARDHGLRKTRG